MKKNKKGMTLIELLAVIAIIAILFILLIPAVSSAIEKSRVSGVQTDLHSYQIAAKSYMADKGDKDITAENFNQHLDRSLQFTSNQSKELNPWGKTYVLEIAEDKQSFVIKTQNKDKKPKEYSLTVSADEEGGIQMDVAGLDGTQKGDSKPPEEACNITNPTDEKHFTVEDIDGGVSIIEYSADGPKDVVIPCRIGEKDVVDISGPNSYTGAFESKSLTSVVFPNTLKSISNYAFRENQLTSVTIPDSVTSIVNAVFKSNQITEFKLSKNMDRISSGLFAENKITNLVIPSHIKHIDGGAFYDNQLTSLTIPEGVETIGDNGYDGISLKLTDDTNEEININNEKNKTYDWFNTTYEIKKLYSMSGGNGDSIDGAFESNPLTSVSLPNSLKYIGGATFADTNLNSVTIPSSVDTIMPLVFYKENLNINIKIEGNPKNLNPYAFSQQYETDTNIKNVKIISNSSAMKKFAEQKGYSYASN